MAQAGASFGVGRYAETRGIYLSPLFAPGGRPTDERRTLHLGSTSSSSPAASCGRRCVAWSTGWPTTGPRRTTGRS